MGATTEDYTSLLQSLLPQGQVWPRETEAVLTLLLAAFAEELARVDGRASDLVDEALPASTVELLSDWERVAGLPDACAGEAASLEARRTELVAKITARGGQSIAYFQTLAASLGYPGLEVEEFSPLRVGFLAGNLAYGEPWAYAWKVRAPGDVFRTVFRVGSRAGEPLASWGEELLECAINARKPAHTNVLFTYYDRLVTDDGDAIITEDGSYLSL